MRLSDLTRATAHQAQTTEPSSARGPRRLRRPNGALAQPVGVGLFPCCIVQGSAVASSSPANGSLPFNEYHQHHLDNSSILPNSEACIQKNLGAVAIHRDSGWRLDILSSGRTRRFYRARRLMPVTADWARGKTALGKITDPAH